MFQSGIIAQDICKRFGTLPVLDAVCLTVDRGEVLGLVGQSGSGKSVLLNILGGLLTPDSGTLSLDGRLMSWPFQAHKLGMGLIHQRPQVIGSIDITANIFLGSEIFWPRLRRGRLVSAQHQMDIQARQILQRLGLAHASLRQSVDSLSAEDQHMLVVARSLLHTSRFLIIDDPMGSLSYHNQHKLLELIREWKQKHVAIIFSSNNLDNLFTVADRIAVLRQGQIVLCQPTSDLDRSDVVSHMVGLAQNQEQTPIIWALERYEAMRQQTEKLARDRQALERDLIARDILNQQLILQLERQMQTLDIANAALQTTQRRLLMEREQERKYLARELHDQTIQDLLALNYQIEEISEIEALSDHQRDTVLDLQQLVNTMIDDLRRICTDLRPPTLDSLGLPSALKSLVHDWMRRSGIPVSLEVDSAIADVSEALALTVFRIVQEALNNVRKHASARSVSIRIWQSAGLLLFTIADDGCGLPPNFNLGLLAQRGRFGLVGISERVALLAGRLKLDNQPTGGLLISIELPLQPIARPSG